MGAAGSRAVAIALGALASAACTSILADQQTFDRTRWHVTAINGYRTSSQEPFFLEFAGSNFRGRLGCNEARGQYRVSGNALVPAGLGWTEMACDAMTPGGIPLMTFEDWGFRVLRRPMQMRWLSGRRLVLGNAAGSIELERIR